MQILVCNDDGVSSPILEALALMLKPYGEVMVIAPESNQSAISHSINIENHYATELKLYKEVEGIKFYSQPYTPVQSVLFCLEFTNFKPDLVVSGINKGYNLGIDTFYSGTVAVAREACLRKISSLAFSVAYDYKEKDLAYLNKMLDIIMKKGLYSKNFSLNINIPKDIFKFNYELCPVAELSSDERSDLAVIKEGIISVSPLSVKMTDYKALNDINKIFDI